MLKSNLITSIHRKYPSLNPNEIEKISDLFFKRIVLGLKEGKKIEIRGFGTLTKKINKAKFVRNPKTNEKIDSMILSIDNKSRIVNLSVKEMEIDEEKKALNKYGSSDSGASLGDILGSVLDKKNNDNA